MKHWIFDFDGTLVDTDGLFGRCMEYALQPFSITVGDNFMEEIRHKHPHRLFEDILDEDKAQLALERMAKIGVELTDEIKAFSGIQEVLTTLEKAKANISIWTGRDKASTERILRKTGLYDFFDQIITGTCVPTNKPGHDGLLQLLEHYQAQGDEMVMTGDHHHDIEPANALGVTSVHAVWKTEPHVLPKKIQPNYQFGCTLEFKMWILEQLK